MCAPEKFLRKGRRKKPEFIPEKRKNNYSSANSRLLRVFIENITPKNIFHTFQDFIFDELNLSKT